MLPDIHPSTTASHTLLHVENMRALLVAETPSKRKQRKNIDICAHKHGHHISTGNINLHHVSTYWNLLYLQNMGLDKPTFGRLAPQLIEPPIEGSCMPQHPGMWKATFFNPPLYSGMRPLYSSPQYFLHAYILKLCFHPWTYTVPGAGVTINLFRYR